MAATSRDDIASLGDDILAGRASGRVRVDFDGFVALLDYLLKREPDRADVSIALAEGRAWATFPAMCSAIVDIYASRPLRKDDFQLPSSARLSVYGGDRRSSREQLRADARDYRAMLASVAVVALMAAAVGGASDVALAVVPSIALASSLFFTVFVLFGVSEIIRSGALQARMFRTGQLQSYLDADRYLVRLAVATFALALVTLTAAEVAPHLASGAHSVTDVELIATLPEAAVAVLLAVSASAMALCLRAVTGYLLDRAAGTTLLDLGPWSLDETRSETSRADRPR